MGMQVRKSYLTHMITPFKLNELGRKISLRPSFLYSVVWYFRNILFSGKIIPDIRNNMSLRLNKRDTVMSRTETRRFPHNHLLRLQTACFQDAFASMSKNATQEVLQVFLEPAETQPNILNRLEADMFSAAGACSAFGAWSGKIVSASVLSDGITPFCKSV